RQDLRCDQREAARGPRGLHAAAFVAGQSAAQQRLARPRGAQPVPAVQEGAAHRSGGRPVRLRVGWPGDRVGRSAEHALVRAERPDAVLGTRGEMMRHQMLYIPLVVLFAFTAACDSFFDLDVNTDPDAATAVPGDLLMPTVLAGIAATRAIEIQPAMAQFVNIWTANGAASVIINPERYQVSVNTVGNTWISFYTDALKNMKLMRDQALADDPVRANVGAQAEIIMAWVYLMATEIWEKVPFTQALDGATYPTPEFDE